MTTTDTQAQEAIQKARVALRRGERVLARRWAEQAAKLAPHLEDPWLILASVASPRASISFLKRALQINPDSPRAHKGMEWALKRLQKVPSIKMTSASGNQAKKVGRSLARKNARRRVTSLTLWFVIGCMVVSVSAWTASTSPALASILNGNPEPGTVPNEQVWARVEIAKPTYTPESELVFTDVEPTQSLPPTPTATLSINEPTTVLPSPQKTVTATLPPSEPTTQPEPSITPVATSTPSGSLVMEIVEDTPVPTAQPTQTTKQKAQNPPVGTGVRWIEVNLSEQRVYAWQGEVLMNSFIVSTGTWATPTVVGTFRIWNKTRIQTMSGPGYSLPNVPYVMYFYKDYGFHGTYWHNNFGTPMSHGCVNLTMADSEWLYNFASVGTTVKVHY